MSYVSLSYFTANHNFLPKAGMHPVFPLKVTNVNTCPQWCQCCDDANDTDDYNRVIGIAQLSQPFGVDRGWGLMSKIIIFLGIE